MTTRGGADRAALGDRDVDRRSARPTTGRRSAGSSCTSRRGRRRRRAARNPPCPSTLNVPATGSIDDGDESVGERDAGLVSPPTRGSRARRARSRPSRSPRPRRSSRGHARILRLLEADPHPGVGPRGEPRRHGGADLVEADAGPLEGPDADREDAPRRRPLSTWTSSIHASSFSRGPWMSAEQRRAPSTRRRRARPGARCARRRPGSRSRRARRRRATTSTTPPRARAARVRDDVAAVAHRVAEAPQRPLRQRRRRSARASSKRCSTASTTSSTLQAQIESCAALRMTSRHATSRSARRPRSRGDEQRGQRLGAALEGALGHAQPRASRPRGSTRRPSARWLGSRCAARPPSTSRPSVGAPSRYSARLEITKLELVLEPVRLGDEPRRGRAGARGGPSRS